MYVHIGDNISVIDKKIIGIFDIESSTIGQITRNFLDNAEKNNEVTYASEKMPKSFILIADGMENDVILSTVSTSTIESRLNLNERVKEV